MYRTVNDRGEEKTCQVAFGRFVASSDTICQICHTQKQHPSNGHLDNNQAACEDQQFINEVSTAVYPGRESYNHRPAFCHIVKYLSLYL